MNEPIADRHPLTWPTGWPRTPTERRARARFHGANGAPLSVAQGLARLRGELARLGAGDTLISTNVPVRLDGLPYSDTREQRDPGVAIYFTLKRKPIALACDRWTRVADNLAALAGHIDALRTIDRYGVGSVEQAFAGYAALPAPRTAASSWWETLRVAPDATLEQVEAAFRAAALQLHPDREGGDGELMALLTDARRRAREALGRST